MMKEKNLTATDKSGHPAAFKVAVALAAIEGKQSLDEIALRYGVSPELAEKWKHRLIEGAVQSFNETESEPAPDREISRNELAVTIAENSTQGLAMMDERGYCIYANRAWLEMTGFTAAEIGSRPLHDLVHHHYPDGRPYPLTECPIDRALPENFEVRAHEDLFFRKDGTTFSVQCAASPIFKNGRPVATVIEIRDITESKRINEELRKSSNRQEFQLQMAECLRNISQPHEVIDAASRLIGQHFHVDRVGYGEIDETANVLTVHRDWTNGTMSSLAGKSFLLDSLGPAVVSKLQSGKTLRLNDIADEAGSPPYAACHADMGTRAMIVVPLLEEKRLTAVLYLHCATARQWTEDEATIAEDTARRTWEAVKRARAEEKLRDESRVLELLNQTGQIVSSTLDLQTLLQSITDTATQLSGAQFGSFFYNKTDEHGDTYMLYTLSGAPREAFEKFGHPRATPLFGPTFTGQTIRSDDILKDSRYGQWGPHHGMPPNHLPVRSYLAVPVVSRSGRVNGALFFGHSQTGMFTERVERIILGVAAQAAVSIDNADLYEESKKASEERAHLLASERAARAEAERLNRMKDEFLAMLAHELRNPLAPITAAAELLRLAYENEPRIQKTSQTIRRQVTHMSRLVDDLLDVSRVTRGLATLNLGIVDFRAIVCGALDQVQSLIDQKHHRVSIQMPDEPVYVNGDETRLIQTVANILNNAAKYTPESGCIEIRLKTTEAELNLHVKDNGTGISADLLPDIFDLFTQGTRSLARSQGGLGLGLALVKKLVQLHGGSVTAHSAGNGNGSEFVISLPCAAPASCEPCTDDNALDDTHSNRLAVRSSGLHLTVVDDNVDAADILASVLRAQGHTVAVHYTPEDVLDQAASHVPHAFLIDIGLPNMDGYQLVRHLRALPHLANAKFVAVTGYGQAQDRERSKAAGFAHHLVKPVDMAALVELLASFRFAPHPRP